MAYCWYLVIKLCLTLLQPHGVFSLPGSSVHGISRARILEWLKNTPEPRGKPPMAFYMAIKKSWSFLLLLLLAHMFINQYTITCLLVC